MLVIFLGHPVCASSSTYRRGYFWHHQPGTKLDILPPLQNRALARRWARRTDALATVELDSVTEVDVEERGGVELEQVETCYRLQLHVWSEI